MPLSDMSIIRRSMTSRMFSTVTTVVTVGVAVGLMMLLLSMRDAGQQAFSRGTGNADMLITRDVSPLTSVLNGMFYADAPARPILFKEFQQLREQYPLAIAVPTQLGDSYRGLPVMATGLEFFTQYSVDPDFKFWETPDKQGWTLAEGRFFERPFEVVLGASAAAQTGLRLGDTIALTHGMPRDPMAHVHDEYSYEIVGILEPTRSAHDRALFTDLMSSWVLHAHDRRVIDMGPDTVTGPEHITEADKMITGIIGNVGPRKAVLPQVLSQLRADSRWTVAQPAGEVIRLFSIVSNIDQILLGMAAAVMVSSAIGVMLALYNSMEQRRRQVAVLRVLGASRGRIFGLVVTESAMIGAMGAVLGLVLAYVGSLVVVEIMRERLGLVFDPTFTPSWLLVTVLATVALATLAGVIPAVVAYRTPVAKNLKPIG